MKFTQLTTKPTVSQKPLVAEEKNTSKRSGKHLTSSLSGLINIGWAGITFLILVVGFSVKVMLHWVFPVGKKRSKLFGPALLGFDRLNDKLVSLLDRSKAQTASRSYLIELSFRNMQAKKTRTIVTVCGMAISIAFIVFLLSVGYGLQNLVTSRVARLDELQQTEVLPGLSEDLALNDVILSRLKNMPQVKSVLPLISVVGRVSFQDSVSDMAVYGTTTQYLTSSAIQPVKGKIFESHDLSRIVGADEALKNNGASDVVGTPQIGKELKQLNFRIQSDSWLRVRSGSSTQDGVLGYTKKVDDSQKGTAVYGSYYSGYKGPDVKDEDEKQLAVWIKSSFLLWQDVACTQDATSSADSNLKVDPECEDGQYIPLRDGGNQQVEKEGYVAQLPGQITDLSASEDNVLGVTSVLAQASQGDVLPLVKMATSSGFVTSEKKTVVEVAKGSLRQAVVNRAVLTILGMNEDQAVGQSITLTFVAAGDLIEGESERVESAPTTYEIVGVTPEEDTPVVYVPFTELRSLGLNRFSQIKVIANNKKELPQLRASIEAMGYGTVSVADTVAQIDNLFATFRLLLSVIGLVALSVAALGMFNTLTVSLLERTREVGLLKAMGMKSEEVRELFLTESMIMGFYGGVLGLLLGFGAGKLLSLVLSSIAVAKGVGMIDVSVVPLNFVAVVVILAVIVGILTGYFPARRATKISALNALRYE